ncbi:Oidioi.mRNA.OKI2018_I69.chr1.g739.t1.cds [Oikopleura dioica]|uniref:Oidioi.mRNA.OKI2018_I69.chr1.g739.t1.cds n=1 Tax=Oikopleura dioica TaxID=34765 RepID=A0ABN7SQ33_OIKDI|nr:Oidioi.mRNA.OKI2018_I69.chr1.g739.t1.cds [Oikopleura dioica]
MVLALVFVIIGQILMFVCGGWNHLLSRSKEENPRIFKNLVRVSAFFFFLAGVFLIIVSSLFTDIILKSYSSDTKFGPVNGNIVVQQQNQNTVRYEFGVCLYLGFIFGFFELSLGLATLCLNPYLKRNQEEEEPDERSDLQYGYDGETFHSYQ